MIEADSVHSTPRTDSSSFPNDRIPPDARSESVDSFSMPLGRPESGDLTGDSAKPGEGLSRRAALAGLALLPAAGPAMADSSADPIFAAIERHRRAYQEYMDNCGEDEIEALVPKEKRRSCMSGALHGEPDWQVAGDDPRWIAHIETVCRTSDEEEDAAIALLNSPNLSTASAAALLRHVMVQETKDCNCWEWHSDLYDDNDNRRSFYFFVMEKVADALAEA
jgi:hypothetical protein